MIYKNEYKLDLEDMSVYLSIPFIEQTKLKEFIHKDKLLTPRELLNALQRNISSMCKQQSNIYTISRIDNSLSILDNFYSKNKNNCSLIEFLTVYDYNSVPLIFEQISEIEFIQVIYNFYMLILLIDYLNISPKILSRNNEWLNIANKIYKRMPLVSEFYKTHYYFLINDIIPLIECYARNDILPLGQLLLKERQQYNIPPTRNIITKGPNDSTVLNLHNVMYSLRTDE